MNPKERDEAVMRAVRAAAQGQQRGSVHASQRSETRFTYVEELNLGTAGTIGKNRVERIAMNEYEAMLARHSVRQYLDIPLDAELRDALEAEVARANAESGLHIQLACEEPEAFAGGLAHYGSFRGVRNYLVLCGPKGAQAEELAGYSGERLVLRAQQLGLNSCWVALTFSKRKTHYTLAPGERLIIVIALGYGATQGTAHSSKSPEKVASAPAPVPDWFAQGVAAALLAPTAINQQKFHFELLEGPELATGKPQVRATCKRGPQAHVDLGIAKYHFELGAGRDAFVWA